MKKKIQHTDGLGPHEIKKIRSALRLVWHRSRARKLCVDRCTDSQGFTRCEQCKKRTPKLKVDHIENVGDVDGGFIKRLFCSSQRLQGLCPMHHNEKTRAERAKLKLKRSKPNAQRS